MTDQRIEFYNPSPLPKGVMDYIQESTAQEKHLEVANLFVGLGIIRSELYRESAKKPHVMFQIIRGFISILSTEDPNPVHFAIVRARIKKEDEKTGEKLLEDLQAIDMLARKLSDYCKNLKRKMKYPEDFLGTFKEFQVEGDSITKEQGIGESALIEIMEFPNASPALESDFEEDGMFVWDKALFTAISTTGKSGKESSKQGLVASRERMMGFKEGNRNPLTFWFNLSPTPEEPFYISPALQLLAKAILEDEVRKKIKFREENVPALTRSVHEPITKLLFPKNDVIKDGEQIKLINQDSLCGLVQIPTVDQRFLATVFNGVKKLNTVTGHKTIRHLVQETFERMVNGDTDYRVLKYNRGATELAEILGINSERQSTDVKEIVHAMAYLELQGTYLTGNLIQLSKYKSPITGRKNEAYLIIVGTQLLPYKTFDAYKNGECGLLIPLLTDPILVNPNQYHAAQYLLQMEIVSEFCKQSVQLADDGAIRISKEKWEELAQVCGLPKDVLAKIRNRWVHDGDDGAKMLEEVEPEFYRLADQKAHCFLVQQGKLRKWQSQKGKTSSTNRAKLRDGKIGKK